MSAFFPKAVIRIAKKLGFERLLSAKSSHPACDLESPLPRQRVAVDKLAVRKDVADVPCV